jgi:hypothetical protein
MRMLARNEGNVFACSWPFDPVGPDAADDLDIVPQIVDIRARVEDQGNSPLSGMPNYIPISGVDVAQLLILDDTSQPLVVNTNPVAKGNKQADTLCDAVNPLLVPTTRPMTAKDALLVTLFPIAPAGIPDMTNTAAMGVTLVGDDLSCFGGGNTKIPDASCEVASNLAKAKWRILNSGGQIIMDLHSEVVRIFPGYAGGGVGSSPAIWTIPKQEAGAANPLCGGTQLDTLANFVSDGWACMAVFASDRLGNKQVSKPMRVCVDKDLNGAECPHREIAAVRDTTPITVETVADHGYATGNQVKVSGIYMPAIVKGTWTVTVTGPRSFTLNGSSGPTVTAGVTYEWTRPSTPVGQPRNFIAGHVVRTSDAPNCTGTQTVEPPMTAIDATACSPWRTYGTGEIRRF